MFSSDTQHPNIILLSTNVTEREGFSRFRASQAVEMRPRHLHSLADVLWDVKDICTLLEEQVEAGQKTLGHLKRRQTPAFGHKSCSPGVSIQKKRPPQPPFQGAVSGYAEGTL